MVKENRKIRILHVITKLAVGGAQENTILSAAHFNRLDRYRAEIACGPTDKVAGSLMGRAKKMGVKVTVIEGMSNNISLYSYAAAVVRLARYIRKERFTIVHTHSSIGGILGRLAARIAGVPVVVHTVHGWGIQPGMRRGKKALYIMMERLCARHTDMLVAVGEDNIRKGLAERIGSPEKYTVIRSGIDIKAYSETQDVAAAKSLLGAEGCLVIGTVGRIDNQKRPEDFVRVAELVSKRRDDVKFVIVGDGPLRKPVEELISKKRLKNIMLTGYRKDVAMLLPAFDIFLLTSSHEGLPRSILEAMAAGKPIVSTNVDGVPEAVKHSTNGLLAGFHDTEKLAKHVSYLLDNPGIAAQMGEQGKKIVPDFSVEKMYYDLEVLYEKLLEEKAGGCRPC